MLKSLGETVRQTIQNKMLITRLGTVGARYSGLLIILGLVLYLVVFLIPGFLMMPIGDDSLFILAAKLYLMGQEPYRDVFFGVFPLSAYFGAVVFKILGPSVIALRMASFMVMASAAWATLEIGKPYLKKSASILLLLYFWLVVFPAGLQYTHHSLSGPLTLWAAYGVVRYLRTKRSRWLCFAGVFTALVLMSTQSLGVLAFIGIGMFLLFYFYHQRSAVGAPQRMLYAVWQSGLLYGLPFIGTCGIFVLWLFLNGVLGQFYQDSIQWLLDNTYSRSTSYLYFVTGFLDVVQVLLSPDKQGYLTVNWIGIPKALATFLVAWIPVLGLLWAMESQIRQFLEKRRWHWEILFLICVTLVTVLSTLTYSTSHHIVLNVWSGYLLAALALANMVKRARVPAVMKWGVGLLCLASYSGILYNIFIYHQFMGNSYSWVTSYGTVEPYFWHPFGRGLSDSFVVETIRKYSSEGEPVYVYNASAHLYLLADRPMAARYELLYPIMHTEKQIQEAADDLIRLQPKVVVDDTKGIGMVEKDHRYANLRHINPILQPIQDYLDQGGYIMRAVDNYRIYVRKDMIQEQEAARKKQ